MLVLKLPFDGLSARWGGGEEEGRTELLALAPSQIHKAPESGTRVRHEENEEQRMTWQVL